MKQCSALVTISRVEIGDKAEREYGFRTFISHNDLQPKK